jgi:anti-sigma-K factor RskA
MPLAEGEHVADLLPDFVLGYLTEDDTRLVNEHLAQCPACQDELTHLQQVMADLPLALAQTNPPPELKGRLIRSIRSHKAKPATSLDQAGFLPQLAAFFRGHLATFSVALIIILALGNLLLWRQRNLSTGEANVPMRVVTLSNTRFSPGAIGKLVMSSNGHDGTVVVDNLALLDPDKTYQVWLIKGATHTSVGVFSVNPSGYASLAITSPQLLAQFDAIGISVEPAGGSVEPTGTSVLHGYLSK